MNINFLAVVTPPSDIYQDASHQNSPAEGPHRYIGEAVFSIMEGCQVPIKLFPYALSHYIKVHDVVPHGESELSPDEFF